MREEQGYDFEGIEARWQKYWEEKRCHEIDTSDGSRKCYCLVMFLYPSGDRLHIGHWYNYGPADTWARYRKMNGARVLEPIGYDAFGLPAENYAISTGVHPAKSTANNIRNIRQQLKAIGAMYDWSKEIDTSASGYYRWTQWVFLQLYRRKLAYRKMAFANWCPGCQTVLANEQVVEGRCERCETEVTKRELEQWFFKITDYADRLLDGHGKIDWPEETKLMQRNWIGRSEGAEVVFKTEGLEREIPVFTTRADTLFGVTYMVLAPEHPLVEEVTLPERKNEVLKYVEQTLKETEIQRTSAEREKTGVFTGAFAVNPVNGERVPVWISDYVLPGYGTGAVMAVPAHDQRDFEFAARFGLEIREVIVPPGANPGRKLAEAYVEDGVMVDSGAFSGMGSAQGREKVVERLGGNGCGRKRVNYRLRDWLVSRQRYWGSPIPIVYCPGCGEVPVPEEQLPVILPENVDFRPRGKGESPLSTSPEFVNTACPSCGAAARRECDTMDTFVCSSWYFLRYPDAKYEKGPFDPYAVKKWLPVDCYVGGREHATMHLLYARFITMVLHDMGHIDFDEPFLRLVHQGVITRNGAKMSKSRGNVVNPDEFIRKYGADTFRVYMMFMGSYEEGGDWNDRGITGIWRFLNRVFRLVSSPRTDVPEETMDARALGRIMHGTIKKTGEDIEKFRFNTGISALMEYVNYLYLNSGLISEKDWDTAISNLVLLIAPFAPHLSEELWHGRSCGPGREESVFGQAWPGYSESAMEEDETVMPVQVCGKLRSRVTVRAGVSEEELKRAVLGDEKVKKWLGNKSVRRFIIVPGKLVNIIV